MTRQESIDWWKNMPYDEQLQVWKNSKIWPHWTYAMVNASTALISMIHIVTMTKQEIINKIDWDKEWDNLEWEEKANFLKLLNIGILTKGTEPFIKAKYNAYKQITEDRGIDKLHLYFINV